MKNKKSTARSLSVALCLIVGAKIRKARKDSGHTLDTLSRESGVSKANISKIENGGNVTITTLYRVCWYVSVEPCDVLPTLSEYWPNKRTTGAAPVTRED